MGSAAEPCACSVSFEAGDCCSGNAASGSQADEIDRLYGNSMGFLLARSERDDPSNRIVGRYPDRYTIAWDHLDAKTSHSTAELSQHFVTSVTLHAIQPTAVHRYNGALHID